MILTKRFDCTVEDLDTVTVTLAKEIENGWHINRIERHPLTMSGTTRMNEPQFSIELCRKENMYRL
jgi:hypothetical protein